jgi:bifunctional UDP-N-acetylglucosamine pyrophosphorylase/glucosamine-1-phosphate N-acetyltransferase
VVPVGVADYRSVLGVNDRLELAAANAVLNARLCEQHMCAGVTIVDPLTTQLEPGVVIGADSIIHPGCTIGGATVIGEDACIGPHVRLRNATLGAAVRVSESVITDSVVGDRTTVGPFAHLRGGNRIGDDVRIGNFVELKKSTLDNGTKAGHLAYVGDAVIGKGVNIGAGVITCNYDGVRKHTTTIGDDAFIGTNNSLVAPVTIGAGAQTGAGTVVIRDVPPGDKVVGVPGRSILKR